MDDPRELLTEVEGPDAVREDLGALFAERRRRFGIARHRIARVEAGITRASEDDRADRDLDRVELPLEVARAAPAEEQEERAHVVTLAHLERRLRR